MSWGIAETASEINKIKAESADYLNGLNSCGVIDYDDYSYAFDFYGGLIDEAYEQGKKDAANPAEQPEIVFCKDCRNKDSNGCCSRWKGLALSGVPIPVDDYDFCSHAERKMEDKT